MNFNSLCLQTLQIMIPHNTDKHYTLYVLNKYTSSIDILDSLNYRDGDGIHGKHTIRITQNWYVNSTLCSNWFSNSCIPLFNAKTQQ